MAGYAIWIVQCHKYFHETYDPSIKDLELYSLGTFNDETGEIKPKVEFIVNASEFIYTGEKICSTQKQEDQAE